MIPYGPEKITLTSGKEIIIKSWDIQEWEKLEKSFLELSKEASFTMHEKEVHFIVEDMKKRLKALNGIESNLYLSAYDGNKLVSYLSMRKPFPDRPWAMHIGEFNLMLLDPYWSQGLDTRLMEIMETAAKKIHITRLETKVRIHNARACNFYIGQKYQIEGKRKNSVFINNIYEDEYYIAKVFEE